MNRQQYKGAIQLDLFIPYEYAYDFKVIVTNKQLSAKKALTFHNGRSAQEGVFAELKSQTQMDYVPTRRRTGNQAYLLSAVLAHNLNREMQLHCHAQERNTTEKRAPVWRFEQLGTVRRKLIQRAGRLTRPRGKLTLTMSANPTVKSELLHYLEVLCGSNLSTASTLLNCDPFQFQSHNRIVVPRWRPQHPTSEACHPVPASPPTLK